MPEGGRTAFPRLGVAASPKKGSMVYWHSLRNDGSRDLMSLHGGCPTAHGIKWGNYRQSLEHCFKIVKRSNVEK